MEGVGDEGFKRVGDVWYTFEARCGVVSIRLSRWITNTTLIVVSVQREQGSFWAADGKDPVLDSPRCPIEHM